LPVIDIGFYKETGYVVTEYVSNGSLRDRIQHKHPNILFLQESINIICQIGQALSYIHQHNIIHRDLKSSNILFNIRDEALITDFDIAILLGSGDSKKTNIMGSPPYMAPEQFEGIVSRQSDQYALGCIAYELCTGRLPFTSPHFVAMQYQHTKEKPIAPRQFNQELPLHIEQAILKAMAKNPADRHTDILTFISALRGR
jgi:serine/threonine protein kinase